jgi:hypothetical protein
MLDAPVNATISMSDCYKDTYRLADKLVLLHDSITSFSTSSAVAPLMYLNQLFIDTSSAMQSCNTVTLIKQFTARTSELSGFFNLLFTLAYGALQINSPIRASMEALHGN